MKDFVHLHVHTEYSLLDGANRVKDLIKRAKEFGMKSVAITDHGVMYGVIDFYKEAIKNGIKPILGCEVYTAPRSRSDRQAGVDSDQGHLVLLAKNHIGYKNLMKLVSIGFTEGFYYKPRVDMEILERYSEGLIALSACLSGDIPRAIINNDYSKAREIAVKLDNIFGRDNFFLELQINGIDEQTLANQGIIRLSNETGIPLVSTNDAHYLRKQDARAHEILLCIQTGKSINDENRMRFSTDEVYFKSPEEMWEQFKNIPEACENTCKIAERCNVEIDFNKLHLPEFDVPDKSDPFEYLKERCYEGMEYRFGDDFDQTRIERLEYELTVIKQMGYVDYFLIVWDFIRYAREHGIMVGPGRGSAAGSLVSFCLGITSIDPIKYSLLFERFLNPERISMPDIDIDFCYERRQEVIDYVVTKYGRDRVAQIITFGTMAARAAIRDVGRALDISYGDVDAVAKMIPFQIGMNIDKALELNPELKARYEDDVKIEELINTARLLEGMPRHASTHAAGVVISKDPITEYVPLQKNEDSGNTTQFTMTILEELGLLKMDFLGLRTLTVIRDAIELVDKNSQIRLDLDRLEMNDPAVFKLIGEGHTAGVFQLESPGMTQFMKDLKPTTLEDIIAGISLYRPGPMDQIPRYINNKNNPGLVEYEHPLLENILDVTYGCMVYQEQVMQIVRDLAGYSMGRSDLVRRAMSKKKVSVMEQERQAFIAGAAVNDVSEKIANSIFDQMMDFASYAFNKSHAAAYAVVAYQTAWLKNYYPVEFMAALLNSFLGSSEKISQYVLDAKQMGIEVLPPDINESDVKFTVVKGKIRFGMVAVKNAGENAVRDIIIERNKNGSYLSFRDVCERISDRDVNKRCVESLIKAGAFDSLGTFRSRLMASYEKMLDSISQCKKRNMDGQLSIFEMSFSSDKNIDCITESYPEIKEFPPKMLLSMEKEMLGLYVSGHPLSEYAEELEQFTTVKSYQLSSFGNEDIEQTEETSRPQSLTDGMEVIVGGIITGKKVKTTRNNKMMAFITLEDLTGNMEVIVFPIILSKYSSILLEENTVIIRGKLSIKEEEQPKIICEDVSPIKKDRPKKLYIKIDSQSERKLQPIKALLKYFNGNIPVFIYNSEDQSVVQLEKEYWTNMDEMFLKELKERLGMDNVKVK